MFTKSKLSILLLMFMFVPGLALAAVPVGVTTAIETAATDVATVGGAVILVIIGIKVWKWLKAAF